MRHLKDIALVAVTVWAAFFAAGIATLLILSQLPDASDDAGQLLYCGLLFVTATFAGALLMRHLHWPRRFLALLVAPGLLTVLVVVNRASTFDPSAPYLESLRFMAQVHIPWFVAAAAIMLGAAIARWKSAATSASDKTI